MPHTYLPLRMSGFRFPRSIFPMPHAVACWRTLGGLSLNSIHGSALCLAVQAAVSTDGTNACLGNWAVAEAPDVQRGVTGTALRSNKKVMGVEWCGPVMGSVWWKWHCGSRASGCSRGTRTCLCSSDGLTPPSQSQLPFQVIVDVGAHEWSRFLPILREDAQAWLVLLEPSRKAPWHHWVGHLSLFIRK